MEIGIRMVRGNAILWRGIEFVGVKSIVSDEISLKLGVVDASHDITRLLIRIRTTAGSIDLPSIRKPLHLVFSFCQDVF